MHELAAIMFSDIAEYTAIMGRDENAAMRALDAHRGTLRTLLAKFNGRLIGEIGDGTLSSFRSAIDAVNCARQVQTLAERDPELRLRIGIHLGDVVFTNDTVIGDGVNVASRIHALAPPGGICISAGVYDEIRNKPGMSAKDLGEKKLKNLSRPVRVYALALDPAVERSTRTTGNKYWATLAACVGAIAIVALGYGIERWRSHATSSVMRWASTPHVIRSIAVLPLDNFSGDPSQEYFADGMTEELIANLAKISALRVISRTSVMRFKGNPQESLPAIGKTLNVDALVEGSVFRAGDRVRITVQLIDARSDAHLWAETYERDSHNVFALQDDLSSAIAREINVKLTPQERNRFVHDRIVNPDAYEAYLKGRYYLAKWTQEGRKRGKEYFEQAIKLDPSFALAYSGLSDYYWQAAEWDLPQLVAMPKAREFALKALRLDNSLAEAFTALGSVDCFFDYDPVTSERDLLRAISVNPGYAEAHHVYGWSLTAQARFEEAQAQMEAAQQLDPLSPQLTADVAMPIGWGGRPAKALEWCRRALELDPSFFGGHYCLAMNYDLMDNHALALAEALRGEALEPAPLIIGVLGYEYARSERRQDAQTCIKRLNSQLGVYVSPYYSAAIYLGLGNTQKALDLLEQAYQQRSGTLVFLGIDRRFDSLRSDPHFRELVKKMGASNKRTGEGMAGEVVPKQH